MLIETKMKFRVLIRSLQFLAKIAININVLIVTKNKVCLVDSDIRETYSKWNFRPHLGIVEQLFSKNFELNKGGKSNHISSPQILLRFQASNQKLWANFKGVGRDIFFDNLKLSL